MNTLEGLNNKNMPNPDKIIYSINIEDIQTVAEEELGRKLSRKELKIIEDKIGNYIDWYEAILTAINKSLLTQDLSTGLKRKMRNSMKNMQR